MPRGKKENLIDLSKRTKEEQREITRMGGTKSGEVRRKRKTFRQALEMLLMDAKLSEPVKLKLKEAGVAEEDMNHMTVILRSLIAKAEGGDVQAYNAIVAQVGEKPDDKLSLTGAMMSEVKIRYVGMDGEDIHFPSSEDEVDLTREKKE
jgi:hypothetical protein